MMKDDDLIGDGFASVLPIIDGLGPLYNVPDNNVYILDGTYVTMAEAMERHVAASKEQFESMNEEARNYLMEKYYGGK